MNQLWHSNPAMRPNVSQALVNLRQISPVPLTMTRLWKFMQNPKTEVNQKKYLNPQAFRALMRDESNNLSEDESQYLIKLYLGWNTFLLILFVDRNTIRSSLDMWSGLLSVLISPTLHCEPRCWNNSATSKTWGYLRTICTIYTPTQNSKIIKTHHIHCVGTEWWELEYGYCATLIDPVVMTCI